MRGLTTNRAETDILNRPVMFVELGNQNDERMAPPHQHEMGELLASTRGALLIDVGDAAWIVSTVHAVWLPPRRMHSARSIGPYSGFRLYVAEKDCSELPQNPCVIRMSALLREAALRVPEPGSDSFDERRDHLAAVILDEIRDSPTESLKVPLPRDARLERIARALIENPSNSRDLESWAEWAAMSSRTLSRRFAAETGYSFSTWRQRVRLIRSLELLASNAPVKAIALDLGYSTPSAFISVFRQNFGDTPSAFRHRH